MKMTTHLSTSILFCAILAGPAFAAGDAQRSEALAYTCLGCHGIEGYLAHALNQYRDGTRKEAVMTQMAAPLTDADVKLLGRYYSRLAGLETTLPK